MKVLLIMPKYFDYPEVISDGLRRLGFDVDFVNDRPSTNSFIKAAIRIKKEVINPYIKSYFDKVMVQVRKNKYDYVLLILGQSLSFSEKMISQLKESQKNAIFILYQWDSMSNIEKTVEYYKYFDKRYSFDRKDAERKDELNFLPLFYSPKYETIGKIKNNEFKYDFSFVGTAHPKKYKFVKEMTSQLRDKYKSQFIYYFLPSRIVYVYRKIHDMEFKNARYSEFHFEPISGKRMDHLIINSKCILDSAQDNQDGLPIRVIESLGAKKKLITTNKDIINYDFYDSRNIYIYDGKGFNFDSPFFKTDYKEVDEKVYRKYSLNSWLKKLLGVH